MKALAILALPLALILAGCPSTSRTLDPAGPYAGDRLLYELDGVIVEATQTFSDVIAWADRNAAYVAAHDNIAEQVAKVRAELDGVPHPTETLTRLHTLRDAYKASKATPTEVNDAMATARVFLETARLLLTVQTPTP